MGKVGSETLAYCTTCKLDLAHTVVSEVNGKLSKVECKTCKKTHKFMNPKGAKDGQEVFKEKVKREKKSVEKKGESKSVNKEWTELMAKKESQKAKPYSPKTVFEVGDIMGHPLFGDGIVRRIIFPNKAEVIFSSDIKILIHGK